mmetsp:Transcript_23336/g.92530  ORF Transcript_23336/g.92530 Transcript_23336/m.92530 type:complete len:315 (-) Transcript_23336:160-1104(-)
MAFSWTWYEHRKKPSAETWSALRKSASRRRRRRFFGLRTTRSQAAAAHGTTAVANVSAAAAATSVDWSSRSRARKTTCAAYQTLPTLSSNTPRSTGKSRLAQSKAPPPARSGAQHAPKVAIVVAPTRASRCTEPATVCVDDPSGPSVQHPARSSKNTAGAKYRAVCLALHASEKHAAATHGRSVATAYAVQSVRPSGTQLYWKWPWSTRMGAGDSTATASDARAPCPSVIRSRTEEVLLLLWSSASQCPARRVRRRSSRPWRSARGSTKKSASQRMTVPRMKARCPGVSYPRLASSATDAGSTRRDACPRSHSA